MSNFNLERKTLEVRFAKSSFQEDDEYYHFSGYGSTFGNIDFGNDVIERGAFTQTLKERMPKLCYQHDLGKPLGVFTEIKEDNRGLFVRGKMPKDNTMCRDVASLIKCGAIDSMSIGFSIMPGGMEWDAEKGVRYLKNLELFEISFVTLPMNPEAKLTAFKSVGANTNLPLAGRDKSWDGSAAEKRIKQYTNSEDEPSAEYKKYFMYYDAEKSDLFGSYKLPFVDIIDGKPHIVPKAIFAIAGVLEGARGGVNIPDTDKSKIKSKVNSLYKRMAKEFNDDSIISPLKGKSEEFEEELSSIRDVESTLRERGLSSKEAKTVISKIKEFSSRDDGDKNGRDANDLKSILDEVKKLTILTTLKTK